ncbi:type II secretion system F family protein [Methylotuvimicrobium buryatense]|uniref:Type II secretion system F family protein n=1 Tax=Methylotuvimicrobium buryatense TaxID=95641 RepID=A0A4V1IKA0_METBY|nr:type II secretion system F family protein [Methylotuvimicrobium buryatense]QCW84175.1 type II secretion system F family protein [Methylotuvimicrobium buryatense]
MALFTYTARDRGGQQVADSIESPNRERAIAALRKQGLLVLGIDEQKPKGEGGQFSLNPLDYRSMHNGDIEHNFHQIAVMLRSGISLLEALELTLAHARFGTRKTWRKLRDRIQEGSSFTEALAEHSIFSQFTIQLVRVGEQTGHLGTVLDQAAHEVKASRKLKKQIISALKYPLFTLLFAIGLVVFMLTSLVPEIKKLLQITGKPMPPITQALIDVSDWFLANGVFIGIGLVSAAACFIAFYSWPTSRWWIDRYALRVPVFGYVFRLSGTVMFSRAMGLLLRSGVVIVEALETMEKLHVNQYMASCVGHARDSILHGVALGDALSPRSGYMPLMLQMVRVGESSGTLDQLLQEMADYHDELLQRAIATLTGMIAPAMTIIVGGVVGFVYAAFLVAMFSAAGGSPS